MNPSSTPPEDTQVPGYFSQRRPRHRLRRRGFSGQTPAADSAESVDAAELAQLGARLKLAQEMALAERSAREAALGEVREKEKQLAQRDARLKEAHNVVEKAKAQVARARSDMEQQRRRFERESNDLRLTAEEKLLRDLFPVLDNFSLALGTARESGDSESLVRGVSMIHEGLMKVLEENGLKQIFPAGEAFDPAFHEAVSTTEDDGQPDSQVMAVLRPGYVLRGKLLRPAMVTVNKLSAQPLPGAERPSEQEPDYPTPPAEAMPPQAQAEDSGKGARRSGDTPLDHAHRLLDQHDD